MADTQHTPGPWDDEPNNATFEEDGFVCTMKRHPTMKHLCGYVDVPKDHPWWGKSEWALDVKAHGGLTYSGGQPDGRWRVGFDCAHSGDLRPGVKTNQSGDVYRDWSYVERQVRSLALQAREAA